MDVDYIIVGFGLAGLAFTEQLEKDKKSFVIYENASQKSSRVAGGIYNPVILKRFTAAWKASEQHTTAISLYRDVESRLRTSFINELPVLRRFNSAEEQNKWFEACDKPVLNTFLSPELIKNRNTLLDIPYHYGKVKYTGRVKVKDMLSSYETYLDTKKSVRKESFIYDTVTFERDTVMYQDIKAKNIVFCEGFGLKKNPFFKYLPLVGNKGEYLIIKSGKLKLKEAVKSSIFIIPLGNDLYKVGATYDNRDTSPGTTRTAREEIQQKLEKFLKTDYEVIDQVTGIRPTVKDRKPLVGTHPELSNIHVLNGLGSRGILIAPYVAEKLYQHIEHGDPLDAEINIMRFEDLR